MLDFTVTCRTAGCDNGDILIDITVEDAEPIVICGVCSVTITDIVAKPAPKKK